MPKVSKQPSHEKLVDLMGPHFVLEPRYFAWGWAPTPQLRARRSAVEALCRARESLPTGYTFKVWDAQRSYSTHVAMLNSFRRRLRLLYPDAPETEIRKLQQRFGGKAMRHIKRMDTHRNGGSFDLTIVDTKGDELYMGSDHDDLTPRAALGYFERKKKLAPLERDAKRNRRLLRKVMTNAGFTGYSYEWWHWSYNK